MFPLAAIERIARKAGVERISKEALESLRRVIEDIGFELTREIILITKHAKRKTIKAEDVKLAAGKL